MVEEISLVVHGDRVILGLIVIMLLIVIKHVMSNWVALIFLNRCFFELFEGLLSIIEIIRRKKYELLHNLNYL